MPENLLISVFDTSKIKAGDAVKVTIYDSETVRYGCVIEARPTEIEILSFDDNHKPVTCIVTPTHLVEELCKIEFL